MYLDMKGRTNSTDPVQSAIEAFLSGRALDKRAYLMIIEGQCCLFLIETICCDPSSEMS